MAPHGHAVRPRLPRCRLRAVRPDRGPDTGRAHRDACDRPPRGGPDGRGAAPPRPARRSRPRRRPLAGRAQPARAPASGGRGPQRRDDAGTAGRRTGARAGPPLPPRRRPRHARRPGQGTRRARPAGGGRDAWPYRMDPDERGHPGRRDGHHGGRDRPGRHRIRLDRRPAHPRVPAELVAHQRPRPRHRHPAPRPRQRPGPPRPPGLARGRSPADPRRRPLHMAPTETRTGVRARPQPGRRRRAGPRDPPLVRAVGPVPHRRGRPERPGAAAGRGRQRDARARRPAER